jgi:antitoxin (DNA-binding transcriptional repressor) of toxin-antitoxin stability system
MRTMTATEVSRNFRKVLDSLERGNDEIVVVRHHHPIARLIPGAPRMTALEALADLHRTLEDSEGAAWIKDAAAADHLRVAERRDPWA